MSAKQLPASLTIEGESVTPRESSAGHHDNVRSSMSSMRSLRSTTTTTSLKRKGFRGQVGMGNIARRTLGIFLLLVTVFLWTASNFLASYIFADNTYSKPYFVTYINTAFFAISLIPIFVRISYQHGIAHLRTSMVEYWQGRMDDYHAVGTKASEGDEEAEDPMTASQTRLLVDDQAGPALSMGGDPRPQEGVLSVPETAVLSLEFCMLWFVANYLVAGCLEYTSVASSTI